MGISCPALRGQSRGISIHVTARHYIRSFVQLLSLDLQAVYTSIQHSCPFLRCFTPFTLVTYAGTVKRAKPLFPNGLCRRRVVAFHRRNIVTLASIATFYDYLPPPPPPSSILASILSSCSTLGVNELASWLDGSRLSQYQAKRRMEDWWIRSYYGSQTQQGLDRDRGRGRGRQLGRFFYT